MRRAYLLIALPAAVVGVFYFIVFHLMGMEVRLAPFLGTAAAFLAAVWIVRRYQKRKIGRTGGRSW